MEAQAHLTVAGQPTLLADLIERRMTVIARSLDEHPREAELQDLGTVLHAVRVPVASDSQPVGPQAGQDGVPDAGEAGGG